MFSFILGFTTLLLFGNKKSFSSIGVAAALGAVLVGGVAGGVGPEPVVP